MYISRSSMNAAPRVCTAGTRAFLPFVPVVAAGVAPPFAVATAATVPATAAGFTAEVVVGFAAVPPAGFAAGVVLAAVVAVVAGRVPGFVFVDEPSATTPGMVFVVAG